MTKKISIVTISYNNYNGLLRTFQSIQTQSAFEVIEWIVIDGLSTDETVNWLKENRQYISKLICEKDSGIYNAMNKGLALANTNYVWFMNSGDALFENKTIENWLKIVNDKFQVYYSDTMFIDTKGNNLGLISKLKPQMYPSKLSFSSFRLGMSICHQSFIVQKSIAPAYNESYRLSSDIDWIIQILKQKPSTYNCNFILSKFEVGGSSYKQQKKAWKERFMLMNTHYGIIPNFFAHMYIVLRAFLFRLSK